MRASIAHIWAWFWRERSGVLLFPRVRGGARLVFEVPLQILGAYAGYLYYYSFPANGQKFLRSSFGNPFAVVAILCIFAYQFGIGYLRDRLPRDADFSSRLVYLVPGRVLAAYRKLYGTDLAVKVLRGLGLVGFVSFSLGLFLWNRGRIFP